MAKLLLVLGLTFFASSASAHALGYTRLSLALERAAVRGTFHVDARDLSALLGLDRDGDGLNSRDVADQAPAIVAHIAHRLELHSEHGECELGAGEVRLEDRWIVLSLDPRCPRDAQRFTVRYDLFFEHDPAHRGHLSFRHGEHTSSAVFTNGHRTHELVAGVDPPWQAFRTYAIEGILHIWLGFDHVLFLLTLLLPCVLGRAPRGAQAREVLGIVTAFTLSHSVTLVLAALEVIALPSRLVESAIALSVILAALHNLRPLFPGRAYLFAFGFGLIHGFGFASVLGELGLPTGRFALGLFAFNVGVELGQLALVALIFPLTWWFRASLRVRTYGMRIGSLAVIAVASVWFVERAYEQPLKPTREPSAEPVARAHASDAAGMATAQRRLAGIARVGGDLPAAAQALRRSIALRTRLGHAAEIARESAELAEIYRQLGQLDDAAATLQGALAHAEALGRTSEHAAYLSQLGLILQRKGALAEARQRYGDALAIVTQSGPVLQLASTLANAAGAARAADDLPEARTLYERALALFEAAGAPDKAARVRELRAEF